jgi:hypothetical protein
MKKRSPFEEAKPRTPRGEARQRELEAAKAIEQLLELDDVEELKRQLAENYGIGPSHQKYDQIMNVWWECRRGGS